MRIDNRDIISTARKLRDEENSQLHVRPWGRRRHFSVPAWLVAVPAAAIVGFVFGVWTNSRQQADAPLTAMADTVYITVREPAATPDTVHRADGAHATAAQPARRDESHKPALPKRRQDVGQPVANDQIRYDLLVKN